MIRRLETIPTLMTLAAFVLMMSLGVWQIQRLHWKEELIAATEKARHMEPLTVLPADAAPGALEFYSAQLRGTFVHEKEFHLAPRYKREKFGYHVLTPLKLKGGQLVLVNRGWIPTEKKQPSTRPETLVKGTVKVEGILRAPQPKRWFMMENKPEENMWFWQDMESFSAALGKPLAPMVLEATGEEEPGVLPVPANAEVSFRNDHLGYAITWFMIAVGILIIFFIYHRRKL